MNIRTRFSACVHFVWLGLVFTASHCAAQLDTLQAEAQAVFEKGHYEGAAAAFEKSLAAARGAGDMSRVADQCFYLGLARQQAAQAASTPEQRQAWLNEAAGSYREALKLRTNSGATLNNLAQVYVAQGSNDLALGALKSAIALEDSRQAFYTENYADLLLQAGRWQDACRFYAQAAWAQPDNRGVHEKLVGACLADDRTLLGTYLWEMVAHGQVVQAQNHAFEAFTRAEWSDEQRVELLTLVAVCLSQQSYPARNFPIGAAAAGLRKITHPSVAEGAGQLIRLHEARAFSPDSYSWWARRIHPDRMPRRGVWPAEAFRQLIRSLARRESVLGNTELAQAYLQLAVDLNREVADPEALTGLAELFTRSDQLERLSALMKQHEDRLFADKGEAYRKADVEKIYRFHRTLGVIYSHLGQWGDSRNRASATFQLEHAIFIAHRAESAATPTPGVVVEPDLVELLATGYEKRNRRDDAFKVRLENAEYFLKAGDPAAAEKVFKPIQDKPAPATLNSNERRRLQLYKTDVLKAPVTTSAPTPESRLGPEGQSVNDRWDTDHLSTAERMAIERSLNRMVRQPATNERAPARFRVLAPNSAPPEIKQVDIEGDKGRVILNRSNRTVQVPFTIKNLPAQSAPNVRYLRP